MLCHHSKSYIILGQVGLEIPKLDGLKLFYSWITKLLLYVYKGQKIRMNICLNHLFF